ncbi:hypothetical protein D3C81_835140 [compost metagenome]
MQKHSGNATRSAQIINVTLVRRDSEISQWESGLFMFGLRPGAACARLALRVADPAAWRCADSAACTGAP